MTELTIIHLLGYLKPKQWADAIRNARTDENKSREKLIIELIREQEKTYDFELMADVEDELR